MTRARLTTTTYTQDRARAGEQAAKAVDKTEAVGRTRRQPGQAKRTSWKAREAAPATSHDRGAIDARDPLAFVPARYADVTINPEQRRAAAQLSVPGLSGQAQQAAEAFAVSAPIST